MNPRSYSAHRIAHSVAGPDPLTLSSPALVLSSSEWTAKARSSASALGPKDRTGWISCGLRLRADGEPQVERRRSDVRQSSITHAAGAHVNYAASYQYLRSISPNEDYNDILLLTPCCRSSRPTVFSLVWVIRQYCYQTRQTCAAASDLTCRLRTRKRDKYRLWHLLIARLKQLFRKTQLFWRDYSFQHSSFKRTIKDVCEIQLLLLHSSVCACVLFLYVFS